MKYKIAFLDIDGTLYSHTTGSIPESAMVALKKAKENGVICFACTGRHMKEIKDLDIPFDLLDGWITLNGALCIYKNDIFSSLPVKKEDLNTLVTYEHKHPFTVIFFQKDRMFANRHDPAVEKELEEIHTPYPAILDIHECLLQDVYQFVPYCKAEIWDPLYDKLDQVQATRWSALALDVLNKNCGKDRGIRETLNYLHFKKEDAIAIGDDMNDIAMMKEVGWRVAMGNAIEEVKNICDFITSDIDNDGLYKAFQKAEII